MIDNKIYNSLCSSKKYCSIDTVGVLQLYYYLLNSNQVSHIENIYEISNDCISLKARNEREENILLKIKHKKQQINDENTILNQQINYLDDYFKQKQIEFSDFVIQIFEPQNYLSPNCFSYEELQTVIHREVTELQIHKKFRALDQNTLEQIGYYLIQCSNLLSMKLNFENNILDDNQAYLIGQKIAQAKNLINLELDLSYNKLGVSGSEKLCSQISKCSNLKILCLNLENNQLTFHGANSLGNGLAHFTKLTVLSLSLNSNMINQNGTPQLAKAISNNQELNQLHLSLNDNLIGEVGFINIFQGVCKCLNLQKLEMLCEECQIGESLSKFTSSAKQLMELKHLVLNLGNNQLLCEGVYNILEGIGFLQNINNLSLDLSENGLAEEGALAIKENLSNLFNLQSLVLSVEGNNLINDGVITIAKSFNKLSNLINLYFNSSQIDIDLQQLYSTLNEVSNCSKLKSLHINYNILSDNYNVNYLENVGQAVRKLKNLQFFYLEMDQVYAYQESIKKTLACIRKHIRIVQAKISFYPF
ncbi:hypothetical protein ABPG72_011444 [Tetrahymena utriculariae]